MLSKGEAAATTETRKKNEANMLAEKIKEVSDG